MKEKSWIKFYRKERIWIPRMTDREFLYYWMARSSAIWDHRNGQFGTFDGRTETVKNELLPHWSIGKINTVKNLLLIKGAIQKTSDHRRFRITNAEIFLRKSQRTENVLQFSEENLHFVEQNIQVPERVDIDIVKGIAHLTREKRMK